MSYFCRKLVYHCFIIMKRRVFIFILLLASIGARAQIELQGRVYHCDLTMEKEFNDIKEQTNNLSQYAKDMDEKELVKSLKAINNATISYLTVKFIDDKKLKYQAVYRLDTDRARIGGASLLMIALMKRKCENWSSTVKANYTLNGRTITAQSKKMKKTGETLSFELSEDGETLTYVTKFKRTKLPRTK